MNDRTASSEPQYNAESRRADLRRADLGLPTATKRWGLALSGGGIRSATFSLGVLQALARAQAPTGGAVEGEQGGEGLGRRLLARFDYLSTVSGGGYIGAFFTSLFIPGRLSQREAGPGDADLHPTQSPRAAAQQAYAVLDYEPPERIHSSADYARGPAGRGPLGWLRENGRYLSPAGGGDLFYVLATTLRNLLSVHFVIGMPLLGLLALMALLKLALGVSLWWLPTVWSGAAVLPLLAAYWLACPRTSQHEPVRLLNPSSLVMTTVCLVLTGSAWGAVAMGWPVSFRLGLAAGSTVLALALVAFVFQALTLPHRPHNNGEDNSVRNYRIQMTRALAQQLMVLLGLLALAGIDSLTQWAFDGMAGLQWTEIAAAGLGPVLIALVRKVAAFSDQKTLPVWVGRLPVGLIAGGVGAAIFVCVAVGWNLLVQWVAAQAIAQSQAVAIGSLAALAFAALLLAFATGRFMGFINLSSLQSFYASRLARAYLGASNGLRYRYAGQRGTPLLSVSDAIKGDDLPLAEFYSAHCAPLHLINVTLNITVDPAEQLVQRDRKGKPLCVAPGIPGNGQGEGVSFILDGVYRQRLAPSLRESELNQPLSLSYWMGTSGAAFTTGLGRATCLGTSLAFGLANIRLGTWWPSAFADRNARGGSLRPGQAPQRRTLSWWASRAFKAQTYLMYELTAHFHGLRREYQYLSDGGHFENTAVYELLRGPRGIELILACDNGCDPSYRFDDLANLIRLARIDQAVELEVDAGIASEAELAPYFATPESFATPIAGPDRRCAVLLNAFSMDEAGARRFQARILVLKPRVIAGLPADVYNYAALNRAFPNESTADQFFNEAQFESYRQLGLHIGQTLFGGSEGQHPAAQALWRYLEKPL